MTIENYLYSKGKLFGSPVLALLIGADELALTRYHLGLGPPAQPELVVPVPDQGAVK